MTQAATAGPFDVVVVGNAGIDSNAYLAGPIDLAHETDYTDNHDMAGQSGGYSAMGFGSLGYRTAFLGYVGDDTMGRFLLDELHDAGVDTSAVLVDPAGTCRSINLMTPDGQRHSCFDGKSHMTLTPDVEAWRPILAGARLVHCSIPNWARRVLPVARGEGCVVSCDLQDVRDLDDPYRADFVAAADVLFLSATHLPDARSAVTTLLECSMARLVVCGFGRHGCLVAERGGGVQHHDAVDLPAPVRDTNGAGDALAVGLLAALVLDGRPLDEAVRRGQLAARWCCTLRGTSRGLITRAELDRLAS